MCDEECEPKLVMEVNDFDACLTCYANLRYNPNKPIKMWAEECEQRYVIQNDDGWYICQACGEELRYNPNNKPPIKIADLYFVKAQTAKMNSRMKNLSKWLDKYNFPFEDELLVDYSSFINKYIELYPNRKN